MSKTLYDQLQEAAAYVRKKSGDRQPSVGLILGSGLGSFAESFENPSFIEYDDIPHFPVSTVVGHAGRLVVGERCGLVCVAMQGRVHYYEGHSASTLVFPVRTLITLGARTLIITNAAGGLRDEFHPGTLMLIRDHLNLLPESPLRGENDDRLGPRFPDMTRAYAPELRALARKVAETTGIELAEGVYAAGPGPAYETPAEVQMLARLGADATGMSTVPEVIAANHMGARVLGISCITNKAAGLTGEALSHEEVTDTAQQIRGVFEGFLEDLLAAISSAGEAT